MKIDLLSAIFVFIRKFRPVHLHWANIDLAASAMICQVAFNRLPTGKTSHNLTVNIELKGHGVTAETYHTIMKYIDQGQLQKEDFIFNTFKWNRLEELRALDPDFKLVPNIKTLQLFGAEQVSMPGFVVAETADYGKNSLDDLRLLHNKIGIHALDCVIQDIRQPLFDFCQQNEIGLYASTSNERICVNELPYILKEMNEYSKHLPVCFFKADNPRQAKLFQTFLENTPNPTMATMLDMYTANSKAAAHQAPIENKM